MGTKSTKKTHQKTDQKAKGTPDLPLTEAHAAQIKGGDFMKIETIRGETTDKVHSRDP
jgi:hypothetical protein